MLAALETAAHRLDAGQPLNPSFFILASDFIQGFADGCHHRKEEGILFPAMEAAGFPSEAGPIAVMLAEHNLGRQLTAAMRAAAESIAAGDASARGPLIQAASDYAALLWQHIAKEENILFPMADSALDGPSQAKVAADFARVEEETGAGVHDRFLALAQTLERQATA